MTGLSFELALFFCPIPSHIYPNFVTKCKFRKVFFVLKPL